METHIMKTACLTILKSAPCPSVDARGIKAEYLRSEACKSLFIGQTFLVLAANASFFVVWLALGQAYLPAISLAAPASVFWRNAWRENRRSASLYIAANLNENA